MIVDLLLEGKAVLVIGGGVQATRRVTDMIREGCSITVVSEQFTDIIANMASDGRIVVLSRSILDDTILDEIHPDIVVATTDDDTLNSIIVRGGKERGMISYSASNAQESDYHHLAVADINDTFKIAISTGGASPAAARAVRDYICTILSDDASAPLQPIGRHPA